MQLNEWAKNEIEIAKNGADEYGVGILNSALKALLSLEQDGHSGLSMGVTKNVLNRLIDYKPLTPLTGDDSEWSDVADRNDDYVCYQNKRYSALFKYVYTNGDVRYSDVDRFSCEDINNGSRWHSGHTVRAVEHFFEPITMPYTPSDEPIVIYTEDFLLDPKNGDFDHKGIFYAKAPHGDTVELNRFLKECGPDFVEISKDEYFKNKRLANGYTTLSKASDDPMCHSDIEEVQSQIDRLTDKGNLSDGDHTFNELYFHRMKLFSIICNSSKEVAWKSKLHDDGTMYDNYFIVGVTTPRGDFSYHYHLDHWDEFKVKEVDKAPKWDGHTSDDIYRLNLLVTD